MLIYVTIFAHAHFFYLFTHIFFICIHSTEEVISFSFSLLFSSFEVAVDISYGKWNLKQMKMAQ